MALRDELATLWQTMNRTLGDKYFEMPTQDTTAYHYTTAEALAAIVRSGTLRASNVLFMNDPLELKYSLELASSTIANMRHHENDVISKAYEMYYKTYFVTRIEPRAERQFVLSFSLDPDSLHLWNAYANNDGYAIGFKLRDLIDGVLSTDPNDSSTKKLRLQERSSLSYHSYSLYYGKMMYSPERQKELVKDAVGFLDNALNLISGRRPGRPPSEMQEEMVPFLQLFAAILYNMKQEPHRIEEEFRIILMPDELAPVVDYTNRNGILTPFVVLGKIADLLSRIVIGPKMRDEAAAKGLRSFLDSNGLAPVEIVQSTIRLR